MRLIFYAVGLVGGALVLGLWMMLTHRLSELGVDVGLSRMGAAVVAFFSVATIGAEEAAHSMRARLERSRTYRLGRGLPEAGQVSVASDGAELSLANRPR